MTWPVIVGESGSWLCPEDRITGLFVSQSSQHRFYIHCGSREPKTQHYTRTTSLVPTDLFPHCRKNNQRNLFSIIIVNFIVLASFNMVTWDCVWLASRSELTYWSKRCDFSHTYIFRTVCRPNAHTSAGLHTSFYSKSFPNILQLPSTHD